jgi:hypothetical protein
LRSRSKVTSAAFAMQAPTSNVQPAPIIDIVNLHDFDLLRIVASTICCRIG